VVELVESVAAGNVHDVVLCLRSGGDPNALGEDGGLPLVLASLSREAALIRLLVDAGADVNGRDGSGSTALLAACSRGMTGAVEELLRAGADPLLCDESGYTPAHVAAKLGLLDCVRALVAAAPAIMHSCREPDGATPLMLAAAENQVR
jgi:ankyrin repeat protein